jgi:hypothetical protein
VESSNFLEIAMALYWGGLGQVAAILRDISYKSAFVTELYWIQLYVWLPSGLHMLMCDFLMACTQKTVKFREYIWNMEDIYKHGVCVCVCVSVCVFKFSGKKIVIWGVGTENGWEEKPFIQFHSDLFLWAICFIRTDLTDLKKKSY